MKPWSWGIIILLSLVLPRTGLPAQARVTLEECQGCRVTASRAVSMGEADGLGTIDHVGSPVKRDRRGNYFVLTPADWKINVFSPEGRHTGVLGRKGAGPGEFERAVAVAIGLEDSVFVFDQGNRRLTVFSPSHALVRSHRLDFGPTHQFVPLPDGAFLMGEPSEHRSVSATRSISSTPRG